MNQDRFSEGPYELGDKIFIRGRSNSWELQTKADVELANHAYAEVRKAAEKETQISAPAGWGEKGLSPLREEQKKEAFNFLWNHANRAGHKMDEKEKDFKELLEIAEALHGDIDFISTSTQDFAAWKKARGIE